MLIKKYFTIADVKKITGLEIHKLRYIEKSDHKIKIFRIRNRRYYTQNDIDYIIETYSLSKASNITNLDSHKIHIISKIDACLEKFQSLLRSNNA